MTEEHRDLQQVLAGITNSRLTRRNVLKYAALGGAFAVAGPLAAACGSSGGTSASTSPSAAGGKKGGSLRVGIVGGSAKERLDGQVALTEPETCITFQLYDALLGWDKDYQQVSLLAEEVTPNTDATVWTVKLRQDAMFSDGKPVTADDVVYSFKRIIDPKDPKRGAGGLSNLPMSGIRKVNASTVEFHLDSPNSVLTDELAAYTNCILPVDFDPKNPIGSGPFKLKTFSAGQQIVFEPNTNYFGQVPWVDELTVIEFADTTARVNALLGGSVEAISQLPTSQVNVVKGSSGMNVLDAKTGAWQPFTMRIDQKPFDDVRVRQAFRLIVDREAMIQQAFAGIGFVGNDMYSPFDPGYPSDLAQRAQDLEQAKSLLKQAGYNGDLQVTLTTSDAVGSSAVAAAQVFAEQAKGAAVTVSVNKVDPSVFYGDQYLKWTFAQDFWYTRSYLSQAGVGTMPGAAYNETHWQNAQWLAIVKEAMATGDATKRDELVGEAEKIEYEQGGLIVWAFNDQVDAYSAKLGGVVPNKSGVPLSSFHFNEFYFV